MHDEAAGVKKSLAVSIINCQ